MMINRGGNDQDLDALFRAFRDACPDPEASANFMPNLWQKIEARQAVTFSFGRMASAFVTAAIALSLALGIYLSLPGGSSYYSQSYVEALAADRGGTETADLFEPIHYEVR